MTLVALAVIETPGGVRSRMTLPHCGSEMFAAVAFPLWFVLLGLSGMA